MTGTDPSTEPSQAEGDVVEPIACWPTTSTDPPPTGRGLYYGWVVVGSVFLMLMIASGLGFYNASVILAAAADELDVQVGAVSGAAALFFATSGLSGFVLSRQIDTRDIRWFYLAGGLLGAGSLASLRFVDTVAELYVFFAVFGVGFATAGLLPGTTLVTRWFEQRRSVALSVASTGLSVGGIVLTPVAAWLIDQRSLAGAGPPLALLWLVGIVPIGLLLIRSNPADKGLLPDGAVAVMAAAPTGNGAGPAEPADEKVQLPGAPFALVIRSRFFLMLCLAYSLIFFAQVGGLAHLFNLAAERTDKATAGTALSLLALSSVVGRLIGGVVVLRVPTRVLSASLTLLQGFSLVALANSFSPAAIMISAVVLGASVGNLLLLQPLILSEAFGVASYSRIYSLNQLAGTVGVAGGPAVLGLIHDGSDYRTAFIVAGLAGGVGFVSFLAAGSVERARALWA